MSALSDRELDLAVAEHVMGWKRGRIFGNGNGEWVQPKETSYFRTDWQGTPSFSTRIEHAFLVVEEMRRRGSVVIVKIDGLRAGDHPTPYTVLIDNHPRVDGASLPRCICLASLAALAANGAS